MKESDIKDYSEYPLSEFFDEEQIINFLHAKYGDTVLVEEWFDAEESDDQADLPNNFTIYESYMTYVEEHHGHSRHPDPRDPDYDGPTDPGEIEWYIIYEAKFNDLLEYLRNTYDAEENFFEIFFHEYVYTQQQRQKYMDTAKTKNIARINSGSGLYRSYRGHHYHKAYYEL
jgi:hypothetical protein